MLLNYTLYGLNVTSEIPIPELELVDFEQSDVVIRRGSVPRPDIPPSRRFEFQYDSDESLYYMDDIGGVIVTAGDQIVADALPGAEEKGFRFILTGIALGILFRQRGLYSFHASTVEIDGNAVGFVGVKGMGKSTLAAAFTKEGYNLVADDLLVVDVKEDTVMALPSFSHLKLLPDALEVALGVDPASVPRIDPEYVKRSYSAASPVVKSSAPLSHIYVLQYPQDDEEVGLPRVTVMSKQEAFLQLVANDYVARLNGHNVTKETLKVHKKIFDNIRVRKLIRKRSLDRIYDSVKCVIDDVQGR